MDLALRSPLGRAALIAAAVALLLATAAATWGDAAVRALLPALAAALAWVEPGFAVQHVDVVHGPAGSRVRTQVMLAHTLVVGGRVVMPHPLGQAFAWVPTAQAWQLPMVFATVVAAWPARRGHEWPWRLAGLLLGLPLLMLFDLPVAITAEFWRALMQAHDPQGWQAHVAWAAFLHGGGRIWLALLAGAAVVRLGMLAAQPRGSGRRRVTV